MQLHTYNPNAWQENPEGFVSHEGFGEPINESTTILEWIKKIDPDSMIDVACIDGRYLAWLREMGYKGDYLGVDITPYFVGLARIKQPKELFRVGDSRDLPVKDGSYNLVLCANLLMHLPEIDKTMSELFRVARDYVIISTYGSKRSVKTTHDDNFLNYWYPRSTIARKISNDWEIEASHAFAPEWDESVLMHQYLIRRKNAPSK